MGYIEVQQSADKVHEKLRMADKDLKVCLVNEEGELLYWEYTGRYGILPQSAGPGKDTGGKICRRGRDRLSGGGCV